MVVGFAPAAVVCVCICACEYAWVCVLGVCSREWIVVWLHKCVRMGR